MKKNSKKNLLITFIILIISILVFIKIFSDSSAKKETKIDVKFIDDEKLLQDEEMQLDPIKEDSKYFVILPEIVNEKKVDSFVIGNNENTESNSQIQDNKNNSNNNSNGEKSTISNTSLNTGTNLNENTKLNDKNEKQNSNANLNNKNENNNEKTDNKKNSANGNASGTKSSTDSKSNGTNNNTDANSLKPGDKVLLDELQIKSQKLEIKVKYQKKQKDNKTLYNKQIEKVIDKNADNNNQEKDIGDENNDAYNKKIIIEGFMPLDSKTSVKVVEDKEKQNLVLNGKDDNTTLKAIYDIKIISEGKEYEPTDFDENVSVKIEGIDTTDKENKKYRVIHIDNNNIANEVTNVDTENNTISFNANSFSEYAVLEENSTSSTSSANALRAPVVMRVANKGAEKWDGTVGTKYVYGDGSKEKPYLISNGKELAYLREQVNNGNSYNGKYFSVVSDIDLNNKEWTPIGTPDNPFNGIFDGAGYEILNATITSSTSFSSGDDKCYGLFGVIGNGSTRSVIKNLEVANFTIKFAGSGNSPSSSGWDDGGEAKVNIGTIAGRMLNNSTIENVIVKNSTISSTSSFKIRGDFQLFVGGIAGQATNTNDNVYGIGSDKYYKIQNCLSNVNINFNTITLKTSGGGWWGDSSSPDASYAKEFAAGGIIGVIQAQQQWPQDSLYTGTINATYGFTGPIFSYLNNGAYLSGGVWNYDTVWQGNNAGGNLVMTSYYYNYTTNGKKFTSTYKTGTTPSNTTYRLSSSQSSSNMKYWQGMNKGIYTNDFEGMLTNFNNYASQKSDLLSWSYANGEYSLTSRFEVSINDINAPNYVSEVKNNYVSNATYSYIWVVNGEENSNKTNTITITTDWKNEYDVQSVVSDGTYYGVANFIVPKLELHITFNKTSTSLIGNIEGTGLQDKNFNLNDYIYEWYRIGIDGEEEKVEGQNKNTISDLNDEFDYKLVANNGKYDYMKAEGTYFYAQRKVVYVDATNGSDYNDGYTEQTAKKTMAGAYRLFDATTSTRNKDVIVIMGTYYTINSSVWYGDRIQEDTSFMTSRSSSTFNKNVTITGKYQGKDYNAVLPFTGEPELNSYSSKYLNADTTFMNLTFDGGLNQNSYSPYTTSGQLYFFLQGYNLTIGKGVKMENYATSNTNQGLYSSKAPAFHIFGGWERYNESRLPRNNNEIKIMSGTYGRVILGGSNGISSQSALNNSTSHNFIGASQSDKFITKCTVDINESTTNTTKYDYDINLLVGGGATGNTYCDCTIDIKNGTIGRMLGGSIGDSSYRTSGYPVNTYIGSSTINISGGTIQEVFGGSLGRNMSAINSSSSNSYLCDVYYYGNIVMNITGGTIAKTIYGAGAGAVTGYNDNSSDTYKSYGKNIQTTVTINITGGTIDATVYGGGYGYTNYLTERTIPQDGGTLYGDSTINISGGTINGDVYAGGCGYDLSSKPKLAEVIGSTNVTINGTPKITGQIYGAGKGLSGYTDMAKLTGNSTININTDTTQDIYGGGRISQMEGNPTINIQKGNHTGNIYGGGNEGKVIGTSTININGGTSLNIFGGGNKAEITKTQVYLNNEGNATTIYGGGNQIGVTETHVYGKGGTSFEIYGGSNQSGEVTSTNVEITSGTITTIYGGNNAGGTTSTSNITINGGKTTTIYGGNNAEGTTSNSNININGGENTTVYGGNNAGGTTTTSNVNINGGKATTVYGGNNQGGITQTSNVTINSGNVDDVYGGGNIATTNLTNVNIKGTVQNSVYGGGNQADVSTNTNVNLINATVNGNVYGGGNEGKVLQNTFVIVKDSTLNSNLYAGGNGANATVSQNTNLLMHGTKNNVKNSVFGGGNKAPTGNKDTNNSNSNVNIAGGKIGKNVYGGANTSVVYGATNTNIGKDTIENYENIEIGDIEISGTVFGGGEANESGSEFYDYSFIGVTKEINVDINGNGYTKYRIDGSIFGSGNASSSAGKSTINITNYGTIKEPKSNISIQRTNLLNIKNSVIELAGTTDRTNEYSDVKFALSRIDQLKLKNNSTLYLSNGANLLQEVDSLLEDSGTETKEIATINEETGETTKNVDNRIYLLEGINLNVATNEQVTTYGKVQGMCFLGIFSSRMNPATSTGYYAHNYNNGDTITNEGTFSSNSYVKAQHLTNHNIKEDGFFTNTKEKDSNTVKVKYIDTSPEDDVYYIWLVGDSTKVKSLSLTLTASKYATMGTKELLLDIFDGKSASNVNFTLTGFSAGLKNGIQLKNKTEINAIEKDEALSNSIFGLSIKTTNKYWKSKGETSFTVEDGNATYSGLKDYAKDNTSNVPSLEFCLYHSQNLTEEQDLGDLKIRFTVLTPIDDLNTDVSYLDINVTLNTKLFPKDYYEASMAPGRKFELFTSTDTTITSKSTFSTYFSLYIPTFSKSEYYKKFGEFNRALISRDSNLDGYTFPENTKITMIDKVTNKYYYYIVTKNDVNNKKSVYRLSDFIAMGTDDLKYDEKNISNNTYYQKDNDLLYENFIFQFDFSNTNMTTDVKNNSLLMEIRDNDNQTLINVLGPQIDSMKYSIYTNKEAKIKLQADLSPTTLYLGNIDYLNVKTKFTQTVVDSKTIFDTQYFDKKLGIKITIIDRDGNQLSSDTLFGINFELDGKRYYPRFDGTTRICISDTVTDILSKIKIHTENNKTLATGDYKIQIDSFGSPDGTYYGITPSDTAKLDLRIINSVYGIKVKTDDNFKIIDKTTGNTKNGNNTLITNVEYSSGLSNPMIAVSLYRRDYSEIYSQNYTLVDLKDYISDELTQTSNDKEYLFTNSPTSSMTGEYHFKQSLKTGTYKIVYKLYDKTSYIGEAYEYFVIK